MPRCYQLIGVPASGKSTWAANQNWAKHCAYISTDVYVSRFAARMGMTYSQVFDTVMFRAVRLMMLAVNRAAQQGKDIIWDQTSTSWVSRRRKFAALPEYQHIAVVFPTPSEEEHIRRLNTRPERIIPEAVLLDMVWHFEPPTQDEGFTEIWYSS